MQQLKGLVKGLDGITQEDIILFCFPFAGGGASAFYGWGKYLENGIKVCPVQLPGREDRIMEQPYQDMRELVQDMIHVILPYRRNKIILFGHSMGAKMAFEVAKELEKNGIYANLLIVSGSRAPHIPESNPIYHLPDEEFKQELERFEGMPKQILEDKELIKFFLPMLRADFTMDESYYTNEQIKLNCPILSLGGTKDKEANLEDIKVWEMYTKKCFGYQMFPGGHFFIREEEEGVLSAIRKNIKKEI